MKISARWFRHSAMLGAFIIGLTSTTIGLGLMATIGIALALGAVWFIIWKKYLS